MDNSKKVKFSCPHCGVAVKATLQLELDKVYDHETETTIVGHKDIEPVKCEACSKYVQVNVASVVFEYEASPLQSV